MSTPNCLATIVGIGNPLFGDDRAGYCVVEGLRRCTSSSVCFYTVEVLSPADTWLLDNTRVAVLIDTVKDQSLRIGSISVYRVDPSMLSRKELGEVLGSLDPHEFDPVRLVLLAYASGTSSSDVFIVGIRGASFGLGDSMSKPVAEALHSVVEKIASILEDYGVNLVVDNSCLREWFFKCTSSL